MTGLTHWHYFILAVILAVLEVFAPGAVLIWIGASSAVVGVVLWLFPAMGWEYQLLLLSILSVVSIAAWHLYAGRHPEATSDHPTLNRRGAQYVGRVFTLEGPITNGLGKIKVDDTTWKIEGDDAESGSKVEVVGVDGTVLRVKVVES